MATEVPTDPAELAARIRQELDEHGESETLAAVKAADAEANLQARARENEPPA